MITNSVAFFNSHIIQPISNNNELIIAVWKLTNPGNIGQIIRLAHNAGAQKVLFINEKIDFRDSKIKKTAGFSFDQMDWEFISVEEFYLLLNKEFRLVILETCNDSTNIFTTILPDKIIILAGNESYGIPPDVIKKSNTKIYIPIPGDCKSMNVSHALSVAAFEWYRQKTK